MSSASLTYRNSTEWKICPGRVNVFTIPKIIRDAIGAAGGVVAAGALISLVLSVGMSCECGFNERIGQGSQRNRRTATHK